MVGRGLRLYPGKEKLTLIDLVGATGKNNLCTAPSLLGIDLNAVPSYKQNEIQGDLFDLPNIVQAVADCPESWIKNIEIVDLWSKGQGYNTHGVNWFKMPNGDLVCTLKENRLIIPAQDELGETTIKGIKLKMQDALDLAYRHLYEKYSEQRYIWDIKQVKKWGKSEASDKQKAIIKRYFKNYDTTELTKSEASLILNRLFYKKEVG